MNLKADSSKIGLIVLFLLAALISGLPFYQIIGAPPDYTSDAYQPQNQNSDTLTGWISSSIDGFGNGIEKMIELKHMPSTSLGDILAYIISCVMGLSVCLLFFIAIRVANTQR